MTSDDMGSAESGNISTDEGTTRNATPRSSHDVVYVKPDKGWAWTVCVAVTIWNMVIGGTVKLYGVLYTEYLTLYGEGPNLTRWTTSAQGISTTIVAIIGGYLADSLEHQQKRGLLFCALLLASMSVALAGYMPNTKSTIAVFGVLGVATGIADPLSLSLIGLYFQKSRTTAYGISFAGAALASIFMPLLFLLTSDWCGFRGSMLLLAGVWLQALFVPTVTFLQSKEKTPQKISSFHDNPGFESPDVSMPPCASESTLSAVPNANISEELTKDNHDTQNTDSNKCCNIGSCHGLVGLFKNYGGFLLSWGTIPLLLSLWFGFFAFIGGFVLIPLLATSQGLSDDSTFWVFVVASVCELISRVVSGVMVDLAGVPKAAILLVSYFISGTAGLVVAFLEPSLETLYVFGLVTGLFGGTIFTISIPMLIDISDERYKGTAAAMFPVVAGSSASLTTVVLVTIETTYGSLKYSVMAQSIAYFVGILIYLGTALTSTIRRKLHSEEFKLS